MEATEGIGGVDSLSSFVWVGLAWSGQVCLVGVDLGLVSLTYPSPHAHYHSFPLFIP